MDRNTELFHSYTDQIERPRSKWERSFNHKTTFNAGVLVPFYIDMDINPGLLLRTALLLYCVYLLH